MIAPRVALLMLTTTEREASGITRWAKAAVREQRGYYPGSINLYRYIDLAGNIGDARNAALEQMARQSQPPDIVLHWDDDDWSAPRRVADQVGMLTALDCVGYNEMLFCARMFFDRPEAWRYLAPFAHYMLGTSMCYWLETWRRHPFAQGNAGCDDLAWVNNAAIRKHSMSGIDPLGNPLMVATVHPANTCTSIVQGATEWERVPVYDEMVRGIFATPPDAWPPEQWEAVHTYGQQRQRA
jgi:hypothetical protein